MRALAAYLLAAARLPATQPTSEPDVSMWSDCRNIAECSAGTRNRLYGVRLATAAKQHMCPPPQGPSYDEQPNGCTLATPQWNVRQPMVEHQVSALDLLLRS